MASLLSAFEFLQSLKNITEVRSLFTPPHVTSFFILSKVKFYSISTAELRNIVLLNRVVFGLFSSFLMNISPPPPQNLEDTFDIRVGVTVASAVAGVVGTIRPRFLIVGGGVVSGLRFPIECVWAEIPYSVCFWAEIPYWVCFWAEYNIRVILWEGIID